MTRYEVLLFLHVLGAIVWIGAAVALDALVWRAERARDRAAELALYEQMEWLAMRLFIPSSLAVLAFGIALVLDGPWTFGRLWIVLGLAGYAFSFLVGILYFKPEGERIGALAESHGPDHPELDRRLRQVNVVGRVESVILVLVVADMALKPTGEDAWTLALGAVVLAGVIAWGGRALWQIRRAPADTAATRA